MSEIAPGSSELGWLSRPLRELLRLSLPITVSMLSYSAMTLVHTYYVGQLGAEQLAGVGLGGTIAYALLAVGFGSMRGARTLVAQAVGAGRRREAGAYLGAALLASVPFSLLALLLQWPVGHLVARSAASGAQGHYFVSYLLVRSLAAPPAMVACALRDVRYGLGDSRTPMVAALSSNISNIVLGWVFIFPLHGGVEGAAWASVVAQTIEMAVLAVRQQRVGWGVTATRSSHFLAFLRVGFPTGVQFLLEMGAFTLLAIAISSLGAAQMAAHQITLQLTSFSFLGTIAIGESAAIIVGQAIGAARSDLVLPVFRLAAKVACAYTGTCTVLLIVFASTIAGQFNVDPDTKRVTVGLLRVSCLFLIVDGVNVVLRAVLRGTGDVVFPAWVGVVCSWCLTPPLAWLLCFHYGMGAVGGWLGMCAEVFLAMVVQCLRLYRGGWRALAASTRAHVIAASNLADGSGAASP